MAVMTPKVKDAYLEHVNQFPLRKIGDEPEYQQALAMFARLGGKEKIDKGTAEYLAVLVDLITNYEIRAGYTIDTAGTSAADLMRHLMAENGLTISALAREINLSHSNLSEMISGRRDWSKRAIKGLSERFRLNPMLFLA